MDINPFIQTAFGAIVGGSVVVATNWLATRAEKKKQTQECWEQTYIAEGIDRLTAYLKSIQIYGVSMNISVGGNPPLLAKPQEVPLEALARVEALLSKDISHIIILAYLASGSDINKQRGEALVAITKVLHILYQIRQEILRNLPRISSRYHQIKITHEYKQLKRDLGDYIGQIYFGTI